MAVFGEQADYNTGIGTVVRVEGEALVQVATEGEFRSAFLVCEIVVFTPFFLVSNI